MYRVKGFVMADKISRRQFVRDGAVIAAGIAAGLTGVKTAYADNPAGEEPSKILNYNRAMEYRRCGKTEMMISAVALGGHWQRANSIMPDLFEGGGWLRAKLCRDDFQKNRHDVVTRSIERGINYVDASTREEVLAYAAALKGRRDKMMLGYSWHVNEPRFDEWRSVEKLKQGLDQGMKEAGLDYVDVWRLSLLTESSQHTGAQVEAVVEALDWAKQTGRARHTGVASHDRKHLKRLIAKYPDQLQIVFTPYTAATKAVDDKAGLWASIKRQDVGWIGIKPFSGNSLFQGDRSPQSPTFEQDNRIARSTIRYILCNRAITAATPGLITQQQVDNVALAVMERQQLDI
jgi:predicted aldo/keto reductase-like oxidoreductase